MLTAGLLAAGAHAASTPDSSHAVTLAKPVPAPARRATTPMRTATSIAAPPTTIAPPSDAAASSIDVVTAQPISFVTAPSDLPAAESTATAAPTRSVALYGDSLTVMAWDHYLWITADDVTTDGHRYDGTQLRDWRDSILSNPNDRLVLALGTNDAMGDGAAPWADLLNKLPASKCIVWPKPYEGGSKVKLFNTQMAAIVAAHPNVHVIDWNAQVQAHPEWVQYDHTHYLPDGSNQYAEMLKQAALTCP